MGRILGNANIDKVYTKQEFPLGATYEQDGRMYRFIKFKTGEGSDVCVAGHLIVGLDTGGSFAFWEGTNDVNSGTGGDASIFANRNRPFGFAQPVFTDASFGFVQISGGNRQVIVTDGGVVQDDVLYAHASTTGGVDSNVSPSGAVEWLVGTALEADGTTSANQLDVGQVDIRGIPTD